MGQLHNHSKIYQPESSEPQRPLWKDSAQFLETFSDNPGKDQELYQCYLDLLKRVGDLEKHSDNFGLIHADLHHGNFFVDKSGELQVFDFDDCHYGFFMYDIGTIVFSLNDFFSSRQKKFDQTHFLKQFYRGYDRKNTLVSDCKAQLNLFSCTRAAQLYFWIKNRFESFDAATQERVAPKLDYAKKLIYNFNLRH